jgi:cytochrome c553
MERTHRIAIALCLAGVTACANLPRSRDLANPDVHGSVLAQQVCSNCHGVTGTSISPNIPILAGQQEAYLVAQLKGFRKQSRRDPAGFEYMWGISRSLTDNQIDELAKYFSAQKPRVQANEASPAHIEAGRGLFAGGVPDKGVPPCGSCHGPEANGNGVFPRLAGQHADYLVKQLTVFQRTDERPDAAVMKTVAHALTRDQFIAVAAYLQAMPNGASSQ